MIAFWGMAMGMRFGDEMAMTQSTAVAGTIAYMGKTAMMFCMANGVMMNYTGMRGMIS